jgi:hypothetical protein
MGRLFRAISIGALVGVLVSLLVAVPAQAAPITVTNTCTGNTCTDTSLVNIRGIASAPLVVKFNLGSFGCYDGSFVCGSARTSGVTATSIQWKWEQQNAFNQWNGTSTIVTRPCTSTLSSTTTYCESGQHLDQLVISGLSSVKIIRVQFRLVNGSDATSWMAGRAGASEYEYVVPSTFIPTAAISSAPTYVEINETFVASAERSNANDGYSDLSQSRFSWDFYNTNLYDVTNSSLAAHTFSYPTSGTRTIRLRISNFHGVTDEETKVVYVSKIPPSATASVSLQGGGLWTNSTRPTLEVSWPKYAMTMNLADQDRSASNVEVQSSFTWDVTWASGSGETKDISIDFFKGDGNPVGEQLSAAISYDIDTPVLNSVSATRTDGALSFSLSATDAHSGLSVVEISDGTTTVTTVYGTSIPSYLSGSNFTVRVQDLAGNWSALQNVVATNVTTPPPSNPSSNTSSPAPSTVASESTAAPAAQPATPRVAAKSRTSGTAVASQAGIALAPGSKVSMTVAKASRAICRVSGGRLVALKPGNCQVTISVTPKKTKLVRKPKATKTPTTVVVS